METIKKQLHNTRSKSRMLLLVQAVSILVALAIFLIIGLALVDWTLRFPSALRLLLLIGWAAWCLWVIYRYLWPAATFNPALTEIALRIESNRPELADHLASSIDFVNSGEHERNPLAARCVRETERRLEQNSIKGVFNSRGPVSWGTLAIIGVVLAVLLIALSPSSASVGLQRVFLPFGSASWPARTSVESLMTDVVGQNMVHPQGQAVHLRARNTTPNGEHERVEAHYRYLMDDQWRPWQTIVLTHQRDGVHERLVDTEASALEVSFSTSDAQTTTQQVALVPPPSVESARLQATPPPYATGLVEPTDAELGQGGNRTASSIKPVLEGSAVTLQLKLNKEIPVPTEPSEQRQWLQDTIGLSDEDLPLFEVDPSDRTSWTLQWTANQTITLALDLEDEHGLHNQEMISYRIDVAKDLIPEVAVLIPKLDEAVLASALVPVEIEARDDVGLQELRIELTPFTDDSSSVSTALWSSTQEAENRLQRMTGEVDLATIKLVEGDELALWGLAADQSFGRENGNPEVRSQPRRLRIISESDFIAQLRQNLGAVRQNAIRIESLQQELEARVRSDGLRQGMDREQGRLVQRMAQQQEAIQELSDLVEMNQLDDELLLELLDETERQMASARNAGAQAVSSIEAGLDAQQDGAEQEENSEAQEENSEAQEPSAQEQQATQEAADHQESARESLAALISLLDRDQDAWVVTRKLESLIEGQNQLAQETSDLAQQTLGRPSEALTEQEREQLDQLAQEQERIAQEAQEMVESLQERAEDLEPFDEQAAEALQRAAQTADSQELLDDMERASDRLEQNQMNVAQNAQRAAEQTLQQMLEEVKDTKRVQVEELLRQLASLIESIDQLILVQERELELLEIAIEQDNFKNRDREMMQLQQNTFAVEGQARSADVSAAPIANLLNQAATAQGSAIGALRSVPVDHKAANDHELQSLSLLKQAYEEAEQLNDDTERQEIEAQRDELIQKYRDELQKQVAVIAESEEVAQGDLPERRKRFEARRLAGTQEEIRTTITGLRDTTEELMETPIFNHVHTLIIAWSKSAEETLLAGTINRDVTEHQKLVASGISSIIDALEEATQPPPEFEDGQGNDGDQGGQGQGNQGAPELIPPIAELKLLRSTQEQIYNQTQAIDAREDLEDTNRNGRLDNLAQQQKDLLQLGQEMLDRLQESQGPAEPSGNDIQEPQSGPRR